MIDCYSVYANYFSGLM